jgi:glutathione S-transferase
MSLRMYDLAGADPEVRFSPYCWRVRMACAHKGLDLETIAWRFTDKDVIAMSGQGAVPVLIDGNDVLHDSWKIAEELDRRYPDRPLLIENEQGRALANFARHFAQTAISSAAFKAVILDIYNAIHEKDRAYFRKSREERFGKTMEEFAISEAEAQAQLRIALSPLRALLQEQSFINGAKPAWADYCVFGSFMWLRNVSPKKLLMEDDPVFAWRERMLDLYGGLARKSKRAAT